MGPTKGHNRRLLPAEMSEFPLSGVKYPPLALRRPLVVSPSDLVVPLLDTCGEKLLR